MSTEKKRETDIVRLDVPVFRAGQKRPNANSASDMNVLADICRAVAHLRIVWSDEDKVLISRRNMVIQLNRLMGGRGTGAGTGEVIYMTIVSHAGDYLVCSDGTNNHNVAKLPALRFSTASETIDAVEYTYSDYDTTTQKRTATWASGSEDQVINPRYAIGGAIFVTAADATGVTVGGVECPYVECSDGRAWAMVTSDKFVSGTFALSAGQRSGTVTGLGLVEAPAQIQVTFHGGAAIFAFVTGTPTASEFTFGLSGAAPAGAVIHYFVTTQ